MFNETFPVYRKQAAGNLISLAKNKKIQHFINNIPVKENSDKELYEHGKLHLKCPDMQQNLTHRFYECILKIACLIIILEKIQ